MRSKLSRVRAGVLWVFWPVLILIRPWMTMPDAAMPPDKLAYVTHKDAKAWADAVRDALANKVLVRWLAPDLVTIVREAIANAEAQALRTDKVRLATNSLLRAINPPDAKLPG